MIQVPPIRLVPQPIDERAAAELTVGFRWAAPETGSRHRLGGEPTFQSMPAPTCSSCSSPMTFYGQLDSISDEISLADAGVVAVWICFDCFEAHARIEST